MHDAAGSAAAPAIRYKNCLRWGSFIPVPPPPAIRWDAASFDHLVGNLQQVATNCQAKRISRLQIYHQLEFSWLLYRQFGRLCPFEDFVQINGGRPGKVGQVYSI